MKVTSLSIQTEKGAVRNAPVVIRLQVICIVSKRLRWNLARIRCIIIENKANRYLVYVKECVFITANISLYIEI